MDRAVQVTYFLLRIVAGLLFVQTGGLILFGWFGGIPGQPGTPPLMSQTGIGGVLEFFGGIAIALGLGTRPVAFILSGMMAVAYWQFHAPNGVSPVPNQGIPAVLYSTINEVAHQRYPPAFRMNAFSSAIFDLRLGSW